MIHKCFSGITRAITNLLFLYLITAMAYCAPGLQDKQQNLVESVNVQILAAATPSAKVLHRMSESVKTIGEHLLLGRSIIEVATRRNYYEQLVRDVFDRVLIGYTVESVEIDPAQTTKIRLNVVPWGDTVRNVSIRIDYSGIAPEAISLVKQDMGKLELEIQAALIGLPIDAVDWATGVARELIREILRRQLPEFHFSLDVEA